MADANAKLSGTPDRRSARTRAAILTAFYHLVLDRGYDGFTVRELIEHAGVGRSTFYEHFENKDAVFESSVARPLVVLADALLDDASPELLRTLVEHFRENRRFARVTFGGSARFVMERVLARLVAERLPPRPVSSAGAIPADLRPHAIAAAQLGIVAAWVTAPSCDAEELARALRGAGRALIG
ncbi:MAG TPA: helix-turn-helix domain-containing protein [Candidatus Elarobacter sp.]